MSFMAGVWIGAALGVFAMCLIYINNDDHWKE